MHEAALRLANGNDGAVTRVAFESFKAHTAEGHEPPDGLFFVELKRPALKGCDDISRYVSWFRVSAREAERLRFVSWAGDVREFAQGVLTTASEAAHFEFGGERIALRGGRGGGTDTDATCP